MSLEQCEDQGSAPTHVGRANRPTLSSCTPPNIAEVMERSKTSQDSDGRDALLPCRFHSDYASCSDLFWSPSRTLDRLREQQNKLLLPLPMPLTNRITEDITDNIIDCVPAHGDLYTCALVCRSWHTHSIRCLYRNISLQTRCTFDLLARQALHNTRVKEHLNWTSRLEVELRDGPTSEPLSFGHVVPHAFHKCMPTLIELRLVNCLPQSYATSFIALLPRFTRISTLTLADCKLRCVSDFLHVISAFPLLCHLTLEDVDCGGPKEPRTAFFAPRVANAARRMHKSGVEHALRRVEVRNTYEWICELLLDWLFAADVAGRLQELTYEPWSKAGSNTSKLEKRMALFVCNSRDPCPPVSGTRGIARILSDPRPHLELLSFRCDPDDRCSLSNAPNLRVLTVTFNTLRSDTWRTSCDEIRHILSSISSNQLVLLTLVLPLAMDLEFRTGQAEIAELKASLPDEDTLKSFHEPLLEHPRFSRPVRVHLALMLFQASHKDYIPSHNQQAVKAMADWARRLFMPWYTRGILFVRVEELRTMWKIHFPLCDKKSF